MTIFKHLDQIITLSPEDDWAIAHIGWLTYLDGNLQLARAKLQDAITRNSNIAKYHYWMGKILWDTKSESPLQELLIAAKLDPSISSHNSSFPIFPIFLMLLLYSLFFFFFNCCLSFFLHVH